MAAPIYLDHNATTPVDPLVLDAMLPFFREHFGNPASGVHLHGHTAQLAVENAREQVAAAVGARPEEIVFTGSCTEADNLAVLGAAAAYPERRHLITTAIEHPAVLEPCIALERNGYALTVLAVDEHGSVDPEEVRAAIRPDTLLVSVMGANNEVGTLQRLEDIGKVCAANEILFHSDLAQNVAYCKVDVSKLGLHLASLSAHKAYGPKGVGAIYVRGRRPRVKLRPFMFGGGQERGLRPGTVATPLAVGMGRAFEIAQARCDSDGDRLLTLCKVFLSRLQSKVEGVQLNGHTSRRLPNNLSLSVTGVEPLALMRLVRAEISFSASSACATDKVQTSHVLTAMFGDTARARTAFRIAPGRFTSTAELDTACDALVTGIIRLRGLSV